MDNKFFDFIEKNYNRLKQYCMVKIVRVGLAFDEDIFSDTIIKCNEKLKESDMKRNEMLAYFWIAFKTNTLREIGYIHHDSLEEMPDICDEEECDNISELYDRISAFIIDRFGGELFELFSLHANGVIYRELYKMTDIKDLKYKFRQIREDVRYVFNDKANGDLV